jgi:predicted phage terminase large subunit-like protein
MKDWFQYYHGEPPKFDRVIQGWDTAFKDRDTNDRSACITAGVNNSGIYLLDCFAGRLQFPDLKDMAGSLYELYKPSALIVEDKASGQSLIQELRRVNSSSGLPLPVIAYKVDRNKRARANAVSPLVRSGKVFLPEGAGWLGDFLHEVISFTGVDGMPDDIVDAFSMVLAYLYWQPTPAIESRVKMSSLALGRDVIDENPKSEILSIASEKSEFGNEFDYDDEDFIF